MSNRFINRKIETDHITHLIEKRNRINIVFSNKGFGKTSLLENHLKKINPDMYINIKTDELLSNSTPDFYFIKKVLDAMNNHLCFESSFQNKKNQIWNNYMRNLSVSFNMGPVGIGYTLPQDYKISIDELVENTKQVEGDIYVHIENVQKMDWISLRYLMRIINETDNVIFFWECSDDADLCNKIEQILSDNMIHVDILSINKLDWSHVSIILKDLNIHITEYTEEEYKSLNGNIKKLIFDNKYGVQKHISINSEQQFLLNFIRLTCTELSIVDLHKILINYNPANRYLFSLPAIKATLKELSALGLVAEMNFNYYYITESGLEYTTNDKIELLISILSNYYMPIIINYEENSDDIIKGLRILTNIYLQYSDLRLIKLIPYIEPNLLHLNGDRNTLDSIYNCLEKMSNINLHSSMLLIAKSYIKIDCFIEAKEIFDKYISIQSNLSIILYATILVHLDADKTSTEHYITNHIKKTTDRVLISALYTCLVSLYMQTKPIAYVLSYINNLSDHVFTRTDYYIIHKNISIYYTPKVALKMLNDCQIYFEKNNYNRLSVATAITRATRHAQIGNINIARRILGELCDNQYLGIKDLIYIENNLSILDILEDKASERSLNKLKEAWSFCSDTYTHLLITNNILIYYVKSGELKKASLCVEELEKAGFDLYKFDDYLHLTYLNLRYYYSTISNVDKVRLYDFRLKDLRDKCNSEELKAYISAGLNGTNTLNKKDRWFFLSSYNYRPAFIGHWIINDFDC